MALHGLHRSMDTLLSCKPAWLSEITELYPMCCFCGIFAKTALQKEISELKHFLDDFTDIIKRSQTAWLSEKICIFYCSDRFF